MTIINIGENNVALECNAFTPIKYRKMFNNDILVEMQQISEDNLNVECIMQLGYCMATQAGETKGFEEWLSQFGLEDFYGAMPDIIGVWANNAKQTSKPKKSQGK